MDKVPFGRFITTFLLFNKDVRYITGKLAGFGYHITDEAVERHFTELKESLPTKYKDLLKNRQIFDINDDGQVDWLKHLGVFEYYDYILNNKKVKKSNQPEYYRWCSDCLWIHGYKDVMVLINILMFNDDSLEEISKVILFKYKKRISTKALELYKRVFWDTEELTAKRALYYCLPFRKSTLILQKLRSGDLEATMMDGGSEDSERNDGSDVPLTFHDSSYIKWKVGYRDISVPTCSEFMNIVKQDSFFKYQEAMNMTHSLEIEEEEGTNEKLGDFSSIRKRKKNVEEQRVKLCKGWSDLFKKAEESIPKTGGKKQEEFFKKMEQLQLGFDEEEKIVRVEDIPDILDDIKGDIE